MGSHFYTTILCDFFHNILSYKNIEFSNFFHVPLFFGRILHMCFLIFVIFFEKQQFLAFSDFFPFLCALFCYSAHENLLHSLYKSLFFFYSILFSGKNQPETSIFPKICVFG